VQADRAVQQLRQLYGHDPVPLGLVAGIRCCHGVLARGLASRAGQCRLVITDI